MYEIWRLIAFTDSGVRTVIGIWHQGRPTPGAIAGIIGPDEASKLDMRVSDKFHLEVELKEIEPKVFIQIKKGESK